MPQGERRFATGGKGGLPQGGKEVCHRDIRDYRRENITWKVISSLNLVKRRPKCVVAV